GHATESRGSERRTHPAELGVVEDIKELRPELQAQWFGQLELLVQSHVEIEDSRTASGRVQAERAECAESRKRVNRSIKPGIDRSRLRYFAVDVGVLAGGGFTGTVWRDPDIQGLAGLRRCDSA